MAGNGASGRPTCEAPDCDEPLVIRGTGRPPRFHSEACRGRAGRLERRARAAKLVALVLSELVMGDPYGKAPARLGEALLELTDSELERLEMASRRHLSTYEAMNVDEKAAQLGHGRRRRSGSTSWVEPPLSTSLAI